MLYILKSYMSQSNTEQSHEYIYLIFESICDLYINVTDLNHPEQNAIVCYNMLF